MTDWFDRNSDAYRSEVDDSVGFSGQDVDFFARRKVDALLASIRRLLGPPADMKVLDIGCGVGVTDGHLVGRVGELHGVDVAAGSVATAAAANPGVDYRSFDGAVLPYDDDAFDVAFAVCVLHHVEPPDRAAFAAEAARVVRPGGLVAVFEHNPFNPLTRVAVSRCEFDEGVVLLRRAEVARLLAAAAMRVEAADYLLFAPFDVPWIARLESHLGWLPAGAQHQVVARVPTDASS